jgi:RNA polymerase sigma-70 factor (ECF subfamily)
VRDPDSALITRVILHDDRDAFGELVKLHQSDVRNLLRRLTHGDFARADDLAQDTFIKAYKSITRFHGRAKFANWLYRIAYNTFLNDQRKAVKLMPVEEVLNRESTPDFQSKTDLIQDLDQALHQLSDSQKAVFDLHYKKGMTHTELSQTIGMPLGTVKTDLARGLEKLRILMKDWKKHA